MRRHRAVLLGVLVTEPRAELHDPLDTDAKGSQLLSADFLRHAATQVLNKKSGAVVLWELGNVETHTLARIERPECADGGPEIISHFRHHHQAFAFHLGRDALGALRP